MDWGCEHPKFNFILTCLIQGNFPDLFTLFYSHTMVIRAVMHFLEFQVFLHSNRSWYKRKQIRNEWRGWERKSKTSHALGTIGNLQLGLSQSFSLVYNDRIVSIWGLGGLIYNWMVFWSLATLNKILTMHEY